MGHLKVCRACLIMDVEMLNVREYPLSTYYESLLDMDILNKRHELPPYVCHECAKYIYKICEFKTKCARAHDALHRIIKTQGKITKDFIKNIDRTALKLTNNHDPIIDDMKHYVTFAVKEEVSLSNILDSRNSYPSKDILPPLSNNRGSFVIDDKTSNSDREDDHFHDFTDDTNNLKNEKMHLQDLQCKMPERLLSKNAKVLKLPKKMLFIGNKYKNGKPDVQSKSAKVSAHSLLKKCIEEEEDIEGYFNIRNLTLEEQKAELAKQKTSKNYRRSNYKCEMCCRGFLNSPAWEKHKTKHDPAAGDNECPVCKLRFKSRKHLTDHARNHKQIYTCKTCSRVSKTLYQAHVHRKWHNGFTYKCQYCQQTYDKRTSYLSHVRIKHPSQIICRLCGKSFISPMGLEQHVTMTHRHTKKCADDSVSADNGSRPYCEECNVKFESEKAYRTHLVTSQNHSESTNPLYCRECGEHFSSIEEVITHQKCEHPKAKSYAKDYVEWPINCQYCPEMLINAKHRYTHYRSAHVGQKYPVNEPRNYVCEICGHRFRYNSLLTYHMATHLGERRFKCGGCDKAFYNPSDLRLHRNVHSKDRRFACNICSKSFKCNSAKIKHQKTHSGMKPFECHICGKSFTESGSRNVHVKTVHLKVPLPPRKTRVKKCKI